jgi:2,4-dienoyl-CoA reductase-like NADH-dependent reductase (Old Yellow Enzyme family)
MDPLFSSSRIGGLTLGNRLICSATYESMADRDGFITDELIKRYINLAKGDIGLIITGYFNVHPRGKAFGRQSGAFDDKFLPGMINLVDEVHRAGGKIAVQIAHGGRQSPKKVTGFAPIAPSAFGFDPVSLNKPVAATDADIHEIIDAFAAAAGRVKASGADAVQLHAAHGYLINEFLSPFFNRRRDEWGGSPENRFRFLKEIILSVKREVGEDFPILVKMNTKDYTPKPGIDYELARQYAGWLADLGIAALEISGGTYFTFHTVRGDIPKEELVRALAWWMRPAAKIIFGKQKKACRFQSIYHFQAAEAIKPVLGQTPLIVVGGIRKLSEMQRVLYEGKADYLSLSRPFIREPFLVKRLKAGKSVEATCTSCNKCFAAVFNDLPLRCYVDGLPSN